MPTENECLRCGSPLKSGVSRNNKTKKFCSRRCYNDWRKAGQTKITCSFCGKTVFLSANRAKSISHCSRKCYIKHAAAGGERVCKDCGKSKSESEFACHTRGKWTRRRICTGCFNAKGTDRAKQPKRRWLNARNRCIRSGQAWDISFDLFLALLLEPCHYCGGFLNETGCGLDRKNNGFGYISDNVVPCCKQCNRVKGHDFSYEEMTLIAPVLRKIRSARCQLNMNSSSS